MPQVTMNVIARVVSVAIDTSGSEPQLVITADLVDSVTGLVFRRVKGNPTGALNQTQRDRITAMITQAQAWADAKLAEVLGS